MKIVAVVPCYKSSNIAYRVVNDLINYVDFVICVDDNCPDKTGQIIEKNTINISIILY